MWRPSVLFSEILCNLRARRLLWGSFFVMFASLIALTTHSEYSAIADLITLSRQLDERGANVVVVDALSTSGAPTIPIERCVALTAAPGVIRAGSESELEPLQFTKAPGSEILPVRVAGDTIAIWDPGATAMNRTGVWVDTTLQQRYGLSDGEAVRLRGDEYVVIGGIFSNSRNSTAGARIAFAGPGVGMTQRCWIELEPPATQAKLLALASVLGSPASGASVRPVLSVDDLVRDPSAAFTSRSSRIAWALTAAVGGSFLGVLVRFRRREIALLRTVGATRVTTFVLLGSEIVVVVIAALLAGTGVESARLLFTTKPGSISTSAYSIAVGGAVAAVMGAICLSLVVLGLVLQGSRLRALKESE